MKRAGGGWSYTIVWPNGSVDEEADSFLRMYEGSGTQKTYAYTLVDHLRWRVREGLGTEKVTLLDLHRYMGAVGARVPMPFGQPWRTPPKKPYGDSGLQTAAACLKDPHCGHLAGGLLHSYCIEYIPITSENQ